MPLTKLKLFLNSHRFTSRVIFNTGWLVSEKGYRLFFGFLVGILVARYLGPENYGLLNYAISLVAFFGSFITLGMGGLVVQELVQRPQSQDLIMGTTFATKLAGGLLALAFYSMLILFTTTPGSQEFWILVLVGFCLLTQPFSQVLDVFFQSRTQSKYKVMARNASLTLVSILRVSLVLAGASVVWFAAAYSLEILLVALLSALAYRLVGGSVGHWRASLDEAIDLLSRSWFLLLSSFCLLVNLKADQIMLRWLSNIKEVGYYSLAVNFSEVWFFLPMAITASAFPRLIELRQKEAAKYNLRLQQAFDILVMCALAFAVLVNLLANRVIPFVYGPAFARSASILIIHIWGGVFFFNAYLISKWAIMEDLLFFYLLVNLAGAATNVLLNLVFIPLWQGNGAAFATLISYATSSYICLFLHPRSRPLALMISRAFVFPVRLMIKGRKIWS